MAQQVNFVPNDIPGSLSVTRNPADTTVRQSSADGRCPRCERRRQEGQCTGVQGDVVHVGS